MERSAMDSDFLDHFLNGLYMIFLALCLSLVQPGVTYEVSFYFTQNCH